MKKRGLLCLMVAGIMALAACGTQTVAVDPGEVVMTVDGQDITRAEYMVYLYTTTQSFIAAGGEDVWTMDFDGVTADEQVTERTQSTIRSVIAAEKYAAENDIALTDEQKEEASAGAQQFIKSITADDLAKIGIDEGTLTPIMEKSYLYSLVYEAIGAEYEADEAEQDAYYEENKETIADSYTTLDVDSIVFDDLETAEEVTERAHNGEDFLELFAQYDLDEDARAQEDGGKMTLYKVQYENSFGTLPEVGEITDVITSGDYYFLLRLNSMTSPTDEEVREIADSSFISTKQSEYCEARLRELMDAQEVTYNEEAINNLETFHS